MKPYNQQEINKFKKQEYKYFKETKEMYKIITEKYIQSIPNTTKQWIIDYKNDKNECLFRGKDYFLIPDVKWNVKDLNFFYGICFPEDETILSIRSLESKHLELLKRIRKEVLHFIYEFTSLKEEEIVMYCHYHPSFWYFHIHFTSIYYPLIGRNNNIGKAILLDTIISNLEIDSNYYKNCDLLISLGTSHVLYNSFEQYSNN